MLPCKIIRRHVRHGGMQIGRPLPWGVRKAVIIPSSTWRLLSHMGGNLSSLNGPDTNYTILGADVLLSMMLYDFGETSANVRAAKHALIAANWQSDGSIQKVMVDVLENAYAVLHAQEVWLRLDFSLEDAERMMNLAMELNHSGMTPISDVYIAKTHMPK